MGKYVVRHGAMRLLGLFEANAKKSYPRNEKVIVRTDRGLEAGEVLLEAEERHIEEIEAKQIGQILRAMTPSDLREATRIDEQRPERFETCRRCIEKLGLEMDLVDIEHIFGGERIIVYYLAEGRVDFRELVKMLAGEFQTRIEMRQIGVRDEAKLLADFGDCGKPVCCNNHLAVMPPVSMKMAKMQKATLDPTKISGRCGRLKCCLRFEFEVYEDMQKTLPAIGARVVIAGEEHRVIGQEVLAEQLLVETSDHVRKLVPFKEIESVLPFQKGSKTEKEKPYREKDRSPEPAPPENGSKRESRSKDGKKDEPTPTNRPDQNREGENREGDSSAVEKKAEPELSRERPDEKGNRDSHPRRP